MALPAKRRPQGSIPRFHLPQSLVTGMQVQLPDPVMRHVQVLRLIAGDSIILFNGQGGEFDARLESVSRNSASAVVGEHGQRERESPLSIVLAQALSSGDRMDYTIQKAVELGATAIQPLAATRSVVQLNGERAQRRVAHWQALVVASCEQCGRNTVPTVHEVIALPAWLDAERDLPATRILLSPRGARSLKSVDPGAERRIVLLAGPEGGFTDEEEESARKTGFVDAMLGPRVLRTETAAVVAMATMQTLWGDF